LGSNPEGRDVSGLFPELFDFGSGGECEVTLKICNEEGRVVEELTEFQAKVSKFSNMREIFEGARRIAMGAEHALDELLRNLGRRAS
jgi:hypothetical protein